MLLYKASRTQDVTAKTAIWLQVAYHADLARKNSPSCSSIAWLLRLPSGPSLCLHMHMQAATEKRQAAHTRSKRKCLPCSFETQNMSDGCSAFVIQAGSSLG
eukprot:6283852-Amphidinium_carterae.2